VDEIILALLSMKVATPVNWLTVRLKSNAQHVVVSKHSLHTLPPVRNNLALNSVLGTQFDPEGGLFKGMA